MRTVNYNPSSLEVNFAKAFHDLTPQIENKLTGTQVVEIKSNYNIDNPQITFKLKDEEGDFHEIVVQVIQRPDHIIK